MEFVIYKESHWNMAPHKEKSNICCRIVVAKKIQVPPFHETVVRGKLDGSWYEVKEGIAEPLESLVNNKKLLMLRAIVSLWLIQQKSQ